MERVIEVLNSASIPTEKEWSNSTRPASLSANTLADAYLAIVAICHQTSPIGERRLGGYVGGKLRWGWDYLKEQFLSEVCTDPSWATPEKWESLTPDELATLYDDINYGRTLNRVSERSYLLNDLGRMMLSQDLHSAIDAFEACKHRLGGSKGFLEWLARSIAYSDPLRKKSYFFVSLANNECSWSPSDIDELLSPVDYHELRGHLRLGTVIVTDQSLSRKLKLGLTITEEEDNELRSVVQEANLVLARESGATNSAIHYLLWNVFRNCCARGSEETHCGKCTEQCQLPKEYREVSTYQDRCWFSSVCSSRNADSKIIDPPYLGHFY